MIHRLCLDTPTGPLLLTEEDGALTRVTWIRDAPDRGDCAGATPLLRRARDQIEAWFAGTRHGFDLPLRLTGSATQQAICAAIAAIPRGETRTYGMLAA